MAESIGRIIDALEDTPIPTILIFAGLFFILLAFVTKVGGFIEVQPAQQKWSAPIGIALLVLGLILALNAPSETSAPGPESSTPAPTTTPVETPQPTGCAAFFREGSVLNWETADNSGMPVNQGTLTIEAVEPNTGEWKGEQITEPKGSATELNKISLGGRFEGTQMTLNNPDHFEIWSGTCGASEINGNLTQQQNRQFTFEMQKQ